MYKLKGIYIGLCYCGNKIGKPALYLDVYGCNRKCNYCIQNYFHKNDIYDSTRYITYGINELLFIISEFNYKNIIIGGSGEPTIQDFSELINILNNANYNVIIETNGKKYSKDLELCDTIIFNIKTFSAGTPYTKRDDMDWYKSKFDKCIFTCTIKNMKDIDYLVDNFSDYDLWLFLEFDELDFNPYLEKILNYDNWRICLRMDRILNLDFKSVHNKRGDLNGRETTSISSI